MVNRWSEDNTLQFVQLYREHDNLWNVFSPEYRNRAARCASMKAIVNDMNLPSFSLKDVPKKIKALRSTYYLELLKIDKSKCGGSRNECVYKPSLPWFNDMAFIMRTVNMKEKETSSDSEIETHGISGTEIDTNIWNELSEPVVLTEQLCTRRCNKSTVQQPVRAKSRGQKKTIAMISDAVEELKKLNKKLGTSASTSVYKEDECDVMGKHIAIQLRELPVHYRLRAHIEIQKILMNFRLRDNENLPSNSTPGFNDS